MTTPMTEPITLGQLQEAYDAMVENESTADEALALADEIMTELTAARSAIAAVRKLHRPETEQVLAYACSNADCGHEDECPMEEIQVCRTCWGLKTDAYDECGFYEEDRYPCATIKALDEATS